MIAKNKIKWNKGLFGRKWAEINGHKVSRLSSGMIIIEWLDARGLPGGVVYSKADDLGAALRFLERR